MPNALMIKQVYLDNFAQQDVRRLNIALIQTRSGADEVEIIARACRDELLRLGALSKKLFDFNVATISNLPFAVQNLANHKSLDVVIVFGDGVSKQFNFSALKASAIESNLLKISLNFNLPVVTAILTETELGNEELRNKGTNLARNAVESALLFEQIESSVEPLLHD